MGKRSTTTENLIVVTLIIIVSSISFKWSDSLIAGGDVFFPIKFNNILKSWSFSWMPNQYLGTLGITYINNIFPFLIYGSVLQFFGSPLILIQKIWIFLLISIAAFSLFYLLTQIGVKKVHSIVPAILAYILSPVHIILYSPPQYPAILLYSTLPMYLAIFIKGLEVKDNNKYIAYFGILAFFTILVGNNPPAFITYYILISFYFLFELVITSFIDLKNKIIFFMKIIFVSILINIFWISNLMFVPHEFISAEMTSKWVERTSVNADLINLIRMVGSWNFWAKAFGSPCFPYAEWYRSAEGEFIGTLIFLLTSLSILFSRKKNRKIMFFSVLVVTSLFLSKGSKPPFGDIYLWLYDIFFILKPFREPFAKFMPLFVLSCSVLLGWLIEVLSTEIKQKKLLILITILICTLIISYGWPFFTGDIIPKERGYFPGREVILPSYWFNTSDYINEHISKDSRILLLPKNLFYQMHYFWWGDGYYGEDPSKYFVLKPMVSEDPKGKYIKPKFAVEFINNFYQNYLKKDFPMWKPLALMNVNYILHRKDLDWTHIGKIKGSLEEPKVVKEKLQSQSYIQLVTSFGKFELEKIRTDQWFLNYIVPNYPYLLNERVLDFYEIDNNYTLPHIYTSNNFTITADINALFKLFQEDYYDPREILALTKNSKVEGLMNNTAEFKELTKTTKFKIDLSSFMLENVPLGCFEDIHYTADGSLVWYVRTNNDNRTDKYSIIKTFARPLDLSDIDHFVIKVYSNSQTIELEFVENLKGTGRESEKYAFRIIHLQPHKWNRIFLNKSEFKYVGGKINWSNINGIRFHITDNEEQTKSTVENENIYIIRDLSAEKIQKIYIASNHIVPHQLTLTFKKINPTKYIVSVENGTEPFFLVFSESYHPQWKIYIEDRPLQFDQIIAEYPQVNVKEAKHDWYKFTPGDVAFLFRKPAVNETLHFMANGYANAWYINPKEFDKDGDGKFTVSIYFLPQSLFYLGLFISGTTLFGCIGYLFYDWRREREMDGP